MFRPRFRLITLLAVMTFIALSAGGFSIYRRVALAEVRALTKISTKGGFVEVCTHGIHIHFVDPKIERFKSWDRERTIGPTGSPRDFRDADLYLLDHIRNLQSVSFGLSQVTTPAAREFQRTHPQCSVSHPGFPERMLDIEGIWLDR